MSAVAEYTYESAPDIVIIVEDQTLRLSELDDFIAEYTGSTAARVTVTSQWGGPAASGLEVEIAVAILASHLLPNITSDAYQLAKRHIVALYHKINPRNPARYYGTAAMALVVTSEDESVVLRFCFPPDLTDTEVLDRWRSVEQNWRRLCDEWSSRVRASLGRGAHQVSISLCWESARGQWFHCDDVDAEG